MANRKKVSRPQPAKAKRATEAKRAKRKRAAKSKLITKAKRSTKSKQPAKAKRSALSPLAFGSLTGVAAQSSPDSDNGVIVPLPGRRG
jgi:hypothetical protein